jgi:phosphonate transport system substrate-binding protein
MKPHWPFIVFPSRPIRLHYALACLLVLGACGGDAEYSRVDFDAKIDVAQPAIQNPERPRLLVAVAAMISPRETFIYYRELIDFIATRLGYDTELVQRKTYGEVNALLAKGTIDLAFICTGPFVGSGQKSGFEAIATPIIRGQPFYRSYLIVQRDSPLQSLSDLEGKDFAFTDPDSNTGALVPRYWLSQMGTAPEVFFRSHTYTYSHDNSIMAVAKKLVDGAAVDGHLWEYYQQRNPYYTSQTRVIHKSEPFGSPPIVVTDQIDPQLKTALIQQLLTMHEDPQGLQILSELMIDRFVAPEHVWYAPVFEMLERLTVNLVEPGDGA